jgi:hypothetical protein
MSGVSLPHENVRCAQQMLHVEVAHQEVLHQETIKQI